MSSEKVKGLTPQQAYDLLEANASAVLIDVRSSMEYLFVGHARGSVHVPWIDEPDWVVDPHFPAHVRKVMLGGLAHGEHKSSPVVLICRSGKRSQEAGEMLLENGFNEVYNVLEGFEGELDHEHHRSTLGGWRFHGLPWEQC